MWLKTVSLIILFAAVVGVLVSLPSYYQSPLLWTIPLIILIGFLVSIEES